jgi:hypothetical protein
MAKIGIKTKTEENAKTSTAYGLGGILRTSEE